MTTNIAYSLLSAFIFFALLVFFEDKIKKMKLPKKKEVIYFSSFKEYLISKRKFLIIWLLIHGTAFFVNVFGLEMNLYNNEYIDSHISEYSLLTKAKFYPAYNEFWPFVKFYTTLYHTDTEEYKDSPMDTYSKKRYIDYEQHFFYGIFVDYDISEFIAYNILLLVFLYFRYDSLTQKLKTREFDFYYNDTDSKIVNVSNESTLNPNQDIQITVKNLKQIIDKEKRLVTGNMGRSKIINLILNNSSNKSDCLILINEYKSINKTDLINDLKELTTNPDIEKELLSPFIVFGLM